MILSEKLFVMTNIDEVNKKRMKEFALSGAGSKVKHWKVEFGVIDAFGTKLEDFFIMSGVSIVDVAQGANEILQKSAAKGEWRGFSIWNIGIMEDCIW